MPETSPGIWDLHFPKAGEDRGWAFGKQPNRPVGPLQEYARSSAFCRNVRAFEPRTGRLRGGSRCGTTKVSEQQVSGTTWVTQHLAGLAGTDFLSPGGGVQVSASGRVVLRVAVAQGRVFTRAPEDTVFTEAVNATGETPGLNYSGLMASTQCIQQLWFADGVNYAVLNPRTNTLEAWTAEAGEMPRDSGGNGSRLLCTWRGRVVHSGLPDDPQNWFASKVVKPKNYQYLDPDRPSTMAVAGNNSPLGLIGSPVTALIPFTDDVLLFGAENNIYAMRGDPLAGGSIDLVTRAIGVAFGQQTWCMDPNGAVYFFSNQCGVFRWEPGGGGAKPQRISQAIDNSLRSVNTGEYTIAMGWYAPREELHLYITNTSRPAATTHYTWESRTGGWQPDTFLNTMHNPLCVLEVDGNRPEDRGLELGSWDGYVRRIDENATTDDGYGIVCEVWIGPLLTKTVDELELRDILGILGESSGDVTVEVFSGRSAEAALAQAKRHDPTVTWSAGRSATAAVKASGHALYVRLTSANRWQMEVIRLRLLNRGYTAARQKGAY